MKEEWMEKEHATKPGPEAASQVDDDIREERKEQLHEREKVLLKDALDAQEDLAMEDMEEKKAEKEAVKEGKEKEADTSAKKTDHIKTATGTGDCGRDFIIDFALAAM